MTILLLLFGCSSGPPIPTSNLPPSESDLDILGSTRLCDTLETIRKEKKSTIARKADWGTGKEWTIETANPLHKKKWLFFDEDETLIAVVSAFPLGLDLSPYPVLQETLSQLVPAREFFDNSNSLLDGTKPDTIQLFRTGDEKSTTQYVIRQHKNHTGQLLVAVVVLDPYEQLLDGAQQQFLSQAIKASPPSQSQKESATQKTPYFLASQQFARGEVALFESCPGGKPDVAIHAYHQTIQIGLDDTKRMAEAHHRLGLALRNTGEFAQAHVALEDSLKINPYAPHVLNSLGSVLTQIHKPSEAITAFEKAIALQPNYARARFNLAEAYEVVDPRRSIEEYETYLALVENVPEEESRVTLVKDRLERLK